MAKRPNPFVDDFVPQSKTHVGLKQFNNNEDRLRKVYEKTLDLLYKGAKKSTVQELINNTTDVNCSRKDNMRQLFIGRDGALLRAGTLMKDTQGSKACKCNGIKTQQCLYCEMSLCEACRHSCAQCEQTFCNNCLLIGSEGADVCVSCYC